MVTCLVIFTGSESKTEAGDGMAGDTVVVDRDVITGTNLLYGHH